MRGTYASWMATMTLTYGFSSSSSVMVRNESCLMPVR